MKASKFNGSLGELEAKVMEIAWSLESVTVREVLNRIKKKRRVAYTTIMTIMTRLCEKGFLKRKLNKDGAYSYEAVQKKEDFLVSASRNAIDKLLKEFGEIAVAQLIDTIEKYDDDNLRELGKKLKK